MARNTTPANGPGDVRFWDRWCERLFTPVARSATPSLPNISAPAGGQSVLGISADWEYDVLGNRYEPELGSPSSPNSWPFRERAVNKKVFWTVLCGVQLVGGFLAWLLVVFFPFHQQYLDELKWRPLVYLAFPVFFVLLLPGSVVVPLVDEPFNLSDTSAIAVAVLINLIFWYAVAVVVSKIRRGALNQ